MFHYFIYFIDVLLGQKCQRGEHTNAADETWAQEPLIERQIAQWEMDLQMGMGELIG